MSKDDLIEIDKKESINKNKVRLNKYADHR